MKKGYLYTALLVLAAVLSFIGCLKDTAVKQYTMYRPQYKTLAQVEAEIKSSAPVAITSPGKLFLIGNYIYLNEKEKGIHIIDNTNPSAPVNKAFIPIPGNLDIAVYGNTLYADCFNNMFSIDISNPLQAKLTHTNKDIFTDRRAAYGFLIDSAHIIYDWTKKDTSMKTDLLDYGAVRNGTFWGCPNCSGGFVQNFSVASSAAASTGKAGSMARFALINQYLYTVTAWQLNTLSLSQPQQPVLHNTISIGGGIETIYPFQDKLFIGSTTGMMIYSVANPQQPVRLGSISHFRACDPVITDGQYAYVTLHSNTTCGGDLNQLEVVNVQNVMQPARIKIYPLTEPKGLSKDGQWLFICDGKAGLKCFDASNPVNLIHKATISMSSTYDVICHNGIAVVSAADGLYQYDYSNINNIKLLSKTGWTL